MKTSPTRSILAFSTLLILVLLSSGQTFTAWAQERALEPPPAAEPAGPSATVSADILNQYVFRGVALSRGDTPVIQPSISASYLGFALSIWGNLDTRQSTNNPLLPVSAGGFLKDDKNARWNETDITLSYTREICKDFSVTFGNIYYQLANTRFDAYELYGGLSYALPWFTVAVTSFKEITHTPGWWVQLDLTKSFPLSFYEGMSLDVGASFGYQIFEDEDSTLDLGGNTGSYSEFHSGTLQAALKIPLHKYVTIAPKVGVAFPLT
ncbi:MAG: hypothetical protein AAGU11_23200, partial [Syntrophobacteraceae bacterium]